MKRVNKRQSISLEMKVKILDRLTTGEKPSHVARSYGLNESTIRTIKLNESKIRKSVATGLSICSKFSTYTRDGTMELWICD